jgi:hypothetical protein
MQSGSLGPAHPERASGNGTSKKRPKRGFEELPEVRFRAEPEGFSPFYI